MALGWWVGGKNLFQIGGAEEPQYLLVSSIKNATISWSHTVLILFLYMENFYKKGVEKQFQCSFLFALIFSDKIWSSIWLSMLTSDKTGSIVISLARISMYWFFMICHFFEQCELLVLHADIVMREQTQHFSWVSKNKSEIAWNLMFGYFGQVPIF